MPPWHIDRTVGIDTFKNDRSLTDAEIDTIVRWVDGGAPRGNPADMPAPVEWPDASKWYFADLFGPPDLVVRSEPYTMPAEANDAWWKPTSETGLTEPRWVRAIEIRPGTTDGRKITHHALARLEQEETDPLLQNAAAIDDNDPLNNSGLFMEWAVGKAGRADAPGQRQADAPPARASAGTCTIRPRVKRSPTTSSSASTSIRRARRPEHRQVLHLMGAGRVDIPPNTVSVTEGFFPLKRAARIESFQPHMHLRGKAMAIEAILPTGAREVMSHVGDFNFNWHNSYVYSDDVAPLLPKGTIVKITAWHDNTAANRANPDPNVLGRLRRPNGRRDGARLGQRHLLHGRGLRGRGGGTRSGSSEQRQLSRRVAAFDGAVAASRRRPHPA